MQIMTMTDFLKTGNILDYPKIGLSDTVWDVETQEIIPEVKDQILEKVSSFLQDQGLNESQQSELIDKMYIVGSITSYQYTLGNENRDGSDVDVHIYLDEYKLRDLFPAPDTEDPSHVDSYNEGLTQLIYHDWRRILNKEEKEYVDGTYHPLEFYFETFLMPEGKYEDGLYELLTDTWEKPPRKIEPDFDINTTYPDIMDGVEKILNDLDGSIGELSRDIEDLDYIKESLGNMPIEKKEIFREKLYAKFDEIEESIESVVTKGKRILEKRKQDYFMYSENNINFKYLQRYGYLWLIKELEDIFEDIQGADEIKQKDIERVEDTLKEFSGKIVRMDHVFR